MYSLPDYAASEDCTVAAVVPPVLVACTFTVPESYVALIVAKSLEPVFVIACTVINAVVPLCTTTPFIALYSLLAESCNVINNSADLYVLALKLMIVVALDVKFTELVSVLATPPDANAVLSKPVIANILAPLCGAEVNVIVVELIV